ILRLAADGCVADEALVLQDQSALAEPVGLGHGFDEHLLGRGGRLMLFLEREMHEAIFLGVFPIEYAKCTRKAVTEIVLANGGFALGTFRPRAVLGVGLIGRDLRLS